MYPQVWTPRIGFASWLLSFAFFLHIFFIFGWRIWLFLSLYWHPLSKTPFLFVCWRLCQVFSICFILIWRLMRPSSMSLFFCSSFFDTLILRKKSMISFLFTSKILTPGLVYGFQERKGSFFFFKGSNWLASDCTCRVLARIFGFNKKWPPVLGKACFWHAVFELFWWVLSWK